MKKIICLLSLFLACTTAHSMKPEKASLSDAELSQSQVAYYINDTFVKSLIGFNLEEYADEVLKDESIQPKEKPFSINGVEYNCKVVVKCKKPITFTTLEEIRKQYCPEVSGDVIYIINTDFVTTDVASYKLDKAFVDRCEVLPSTEFELFKDSKKPFSILHVYTKEYTQAIRLK